MEKKHLIIFFVLICALFAFKANAQIQNADVSLSINPQYPKANESVTASLTTYSTDLNNARISWTLDGSTALEGIGRKTFSFKVGSYGFQTILEVEIETLDGSSINKKIIITPSSVDMLWMAYNAYVPPFYKGKTLASVEGPVKVVAIPSNQNLAGYNYKWKKDDKNKQASSGYEKNYYIYTNNYLEDTNNVEVDISDLFGNDIGIGKVSIKPGNPKIIFYNKDQILGTKWENSLKDEHMIDKNGEAIVAEPYFFSIKDLNSPNYSFEWSLNGEKTPTPNPKNILAIKPENNKSGSTVMKVIINNTKTLFQSMSKEINVNF